MLQKFDICNSSVSILSMLLLTKYCFQVHSFLRLNFDLKRNLLIKVGLPQLFSLGGYTYKKNWIPEISTSEM